MAELVRFYLWNLSHVSCQPLKESKKAFPVNLRIQLPVSFVLVVTKPGRSCFLLPLKAQLENKEEAQEVFVSLAAAKEIRVGAVITTALSELDGIFTL